MGDAETALGRLLAELCWRPETLADKLNRFAQLQAMPHKVHPKTPYRWRAGTSPHQPWPALVCAVLSEHLRRAVTPVELGWSDNGTELICATHGLDLPWTSAGSLRASQVVAEGGGMDRRIFLTAFGSALTTPALEWLIAHPADDLSTRAGHALPVEVVDGFDAMTDSLRRMDDQIGGRQTLGLVRNHLGVVTDLIENRRYTETIGRRLHACLGELLRLAGWLAFDSGVHSQAQRFWIAALHAAHAAGDQALAANVLGFMSCQAKDIGQIREAVTLAEAARTGCRSASPKVATILDLRAAEAYANAGDLERTRAAIDTAFNRFGDTAPSSGDPAWAYWITPAHARAQAGYSYLKLGSWDRARQHLRIARGQHHRESAREGALRDVLLASTYTRQEHPDLERACDLGGQALRTLGTQVDSPRCVRHVRALTEDLRPYRRSPAVRRFTADAIELLQE